MTLNLSILDTTGIVNYCRQVSFKTKCCKLTVYTGMRLWGRCPLKPGCPGIPLDRWFTCTFLVEKN